MKFARYWTRGEAESRSATGKSFRAWARGWSDDSLEAARARAQEIARKVAERIASGPSGVQERYPYGQRPLPEPVLREFRRPGGDLSAIVTRNAYGSLVLNTDSLMFVDVDGRGNHPTRATFGQMISLLFGKSTPSPAPNPVPDAMNDVAQRRGLSVRVYETAAGYRLLITNTPFKPDSAEALALLSEFGSDPLYIRLCRLQESFRARLTPKPWRCHLHSLPGSFPFETTAEQDRYRRWEAEYDSKTASYATCRYVASLGQGTVIPEFNELIRYHDTVTKSASVEPLA